MYTSPNTHYSQHQNRVDRMKDSTETRIHTLESTSFHNRKRMIEDNVERSFDLDAKN